MVTHKVTHKIPENRYEAFYYRYTQQNGHLPHKITHEGLENKYEMLYKIGILS